MRTLIIPDIHDRIDLLKPIHDEYVSWASQIVYLGDWTDSFHHGHQTEDTLKFLTQELELGSYAHELSRVFLWGNHDFQYHDPAPIYRCSGYHKETAALWARLLPKGWASKFQFYAYVDEWLISHAGFNKPPEEWDEIDMPKAVGLARGGRHACGGPLWLDWDQEFLGFRPAAQGYQMQIVGHTHHPFPIVDKSGVCLDTGLRYVGLLDKTLQIVKVG